MASNGRGRTFVIFKLGLEDGPAERAREPRRHSVRPPLGWDRGRRIAPPGLWFGMVSGQGISDARRSASGELLGSDPMRQDPGPFGAPRGARHVQTAWKSGPTQTQTQTASGRERSFELLVHFHQSRRRACLRHAHRSGAALAAAAYRPHDPRARGAGRRHLHFPGRAVWRGDRHPHGRAGRQRHRLSRCRPDHARRAERPRPAGRGDDLGDGRGGDAGRLAFWPRRRRRRRS